MIIVCFVCFIFVLFHEKYVIICLNSLSTDCINGLCKGDVKNEKNDKDRLEERLSN